MVRFIDQPPAAKKSEKSRQLVPGSENKGQLGQLLPQRRPAPPTGQVPGPIPNASIVYGSAAAVMLVIALYTMFKLANWFTGLLILILAGTLAGYAWYFMRYR